MGIVLTKVNARKNYFKQTMETLQELDGISIKWQGNAATAFMEEIRVWWEASYHQVERLQEVGKLLSQAEERVRLCEEQVKQETGGWFG